MKSLRTKRLVLRQWYLSDTDDLFEYARNPLVGPSAGWSPHHSRADSEELIKKVFQQEYFHWAIVLPAAGKVIGSINLTKDIKRNNAQALTLGYSMHPDFWGNGYMTEAAKAVISFGFESLNTVLISVYHYPDNLRSKRVIEKCGFTFEGTLRLCSHLFNGKVHDNLCYSMTMPEFKKLKQDGIL
ncbi:MAG: GNAT family N-acetyltransferase [Victivallales bacterium]|nr:GNAT family N-acetyltransferase [Victivallales bacterium]